MIKFDEQQKKMVQHLVYCGPAMSGRTTNLLSMQDQLSLEWRGICGRYCG